MSTGNSSQPNKQDSKGSFFKLIDSFAWELGTLKREMGKKPKPAEGENSKDTPLGLGEEVGHLFLRTSPPTGTRTVPSGVRDLGYNSLQRRLSVLDRLVQTHAVWLQLGLSHWDATQILQSQPSGTFLVRRSSSLQRKVISVRMDQDSARPVKDFLVRESQYTFSLEGSGLSFADLFRLVAFFCISRDVLPFTLKLPEAIASARTSADLEEVAKLGAGFWKRSKGSVTPSGITAPERPPPPTQRPISTETTPGRPWLRVRTPSELECCQSNGALCFINPLFIKVHQNETDKHTPSNPQGPEKQSLGEEQTNSTGSYCCRDNSQVCGSEAFDSSLQGTGKSKQVEEVSSNPSKGQKPSTVESAKQYPPPRPPPPRFVAKGSAQLIRQQSMPVKASWINFPKERVEETGDRGISRLSRLSSSLSISPSSSPPNRLNLSSPISIPWPSLVKASPSSSQEDAQCHLALEDNTIEEALMRAKLFQHKASRSPPQDSSSPQDSSMTGGKEEMKECGNGGQRLSDMSISTDSSDSLDYSQSLPFFLPPLHDPSPPTVADFNTHLPLSLPPSILPYMEEDDEDEEDDDEDEADYGVSLESDQDQDQDLTMVPPGHRTRRRPSAGALVLLRKMSYVFNSLLTPEKRAIRRVLELSRNRSSYFGCLVQDYLSYMGEGAGTQAWQGYASGLELLQTLRQFITQMKNYLIESSELQPPIQSLIPEEQIDRVLEKAMHKCVLKPLLSVVRAALQEFQVRSGEWQELKDNLALAKARPPQEMGITDTLLPYPVAIEKIKQRFHTMIKLYSPEKKVRMLLKVCGLIYAIMADNSGRPYGADDFLPMLTYVLAQCDMPQVDNEILYMMELLDPSLLHGEGGYYLTSAYGAMSLIKNFQEEKAAKVLSSEARDTLHQWHRRRTLTQRSAPCIDDFQNYLRVALHELDSGCTAKTLQVRPHATVEEVCQLSANKFKVSEPSRYGLFLVMGGSSQQLAPDTHPQKIKAELHSRRQVDPFYFVYRRISNISTSPADLLNPTSNLNELVHADLSLLPNHLNSGSISV